MRKNISSALAGFLAALLLWCLLPVTAEAAGASFSGSGSVRAGDSVTVTFSVSGSNIQGITAVLHYDSSTLTLTCWPITIISTTPSTAAPPFWPSRSG